MNKRFTKFMSVILCAVMIFTTASVAFAAEDGRKVVDSGFCGAEGENLTWTLYDDGELVISGEGEMDWYFVDYQWGKLEILPPWYDYLSAIDVITVEEGVTGIGNDAFSGEYAGYYRINLPKSLEYMEGYFDWDPDTSDRGRYVAICYAGSEAQWKQIPRNIYEYYLNYEKNGYNRRHYSIEYGYNSDSVRYGIKNVLLCFDGEEPKPTIDIRSFGSDTDLNESTASRRVMAYYYTGNNEDVEIVWSVKGSDAVEIVEYIENTDSTGLTVEVAILGVEFGRSKVVAELVDKDGNVIVSDSEKFMSYVPVKMNIFEAIYYYGTMGFGMIGGTWLASTFAFFVYIEEFFIDPKGTLEKIFSK